MVLDDFPKFKVTRHDSELQTVVKKHTLLSFVLYFTFDEHFLVINMISVCKG